MTTKKKKKTWSLKKADTEYRALRLEIDPPHVICIFPGCNITNPSKLTLSHYFGRVAKLLRYDDDNCDWLCRNHHYWDKQLGWEFQKQIKEKHGWDGQYTLYMKKKLGEERFYEMLELSKITGSKKKVIEALMERVACFRKATSG